MKRGRGGTMLVREKRWKQDKSVLNASMKQLDQRKGRKESKKKENYEGSLFLCGACGPLGFVDLSFMQLSFSHPDPLKGAISSSTSSSN
jgi:hypothetical protein